MKKVCEVALSGGVDSAAAAVLLLQQNYEVRGVTLRLKPGNLADADIADAKRVADTLGIPFTVLDCREEFRAVTDAFCREYLRGRTPNPCVLCNPTLKFGELLRHARTNGADFIATGHYARVLRDENGDFALRTNPSDKDQSYFLCRLNQQILSQVLFPLGLHTKPEARLLAREAGLPVAEKKDSQEVCFIPDNDYISFIEREKHPDPRPGEMLFTDGTRAGTHTGLYKYTIGQRKGLGAFGKPMYVVALDAEKNTVTIGENEALMTTRITVEDLSFLSGTVPAEAFRCGVKIRCAAPRAEALFLPKKDGTAEIQFDSPVRAACPGQTAALYRDNLLLGGATIR